MERADHCETRASLSPSAGLILETLFLCLGVGLILAGAFKGIDRIVGDLSITFVAIVLEAVPFVLVGTVIGGLIEEFVPQEFIQRRLGSGSTTALLAAAALGIVFPVCECAIVPVVGRLLRKGVPVPVAVAFLLAVPLVNPVVGASTALAYRFDWTVVALRLGCGYAIAVCAALLVQRLYRNQTALMEDRSLPVEECCCHCHEHEAAPEADRIVYRLFLALRHACNDFFDVGRFLFLGAFVAAGARTFIGMDTYVELMNTPWLAIALMMALAVALNLCSEADAFIAASFRGIIPSSAQLSFMLLGPMLDLKLLLMYSTVFRPRFIALLSIVVIALVFVTSLAAQYVLGEVISAPW